MIFKILFVILILTAVCPIGLRMGFQGSFLWIGLDILTNYDSTFRSQTNITKPMAESPLFLQIGPSFSLSKLLSLTEISKAPMAEIFTALYFHPQTKNSILSQFLISFLSSQFGFCGQQIWVFWGGCGGSSQVKLTCEGSLEGGEDQLGWTRT